MKKTFLWGVLAGAVGTGYLLKKNKVNNFVKKIKKD